MRREELFMDILGGLDEKYVSMAMPHSCGHSTVGDTGNVIEIKPVEVSPEVSRKDLRIYWITRVLGMAAAVVLIVGAAVLLIMNWDKIAVKEPDRPGIVTTVTTVSEPVITNDTTSSTTTEPDIVDRFEQITDTSMPEPFDSAEYPLGNYDFGSPWQAKFFNTDYIFEYNSNKYNEHRKKNEGIETPYTLFDSTNFFGYAKAAELTDEQIVEAIEKRNDFIKQDQTLYNKLDYIYSENDISVLLSGDVSRIAQHFASEYSIVVGENVFMPWWLYYHTVDDYKAAGIPTSELLKKMILYEKLGLTDEAWKAFCKKVYPYITKHDIPASELDKLIIYENDTSEPVGDRAFEILEEVFYGEWKISENSRYPDRTLPLIYSKSHLFNLTAVFEYDDMYILTYTSSGGIGCCCIVKKDDPDVMYSTEIGFGIGSTYIISSFDDMGKYTERMYATPRLNIGSEISPLGEKYLIHKYGDEFNKVYTDKLDYWRVSFDTVAFEDEGGSWYLANGYTSSDIGRYLIAMSDNAVTLGVPYVRDSRELEQTPEYFAVTFTKNESGEWSIEYSSTDIKALISKMNDDLIPAVGVNGKEGYIHSNELFAAPSSVEEAKSQREEMKNGTYDLKTVYVYKADGKTIIDTFTESPEADPEKVILNDDGTYTVVFD